MIDTSKAVGLDTILRNLNNLIKEVEGDISKGMMLGMQLIKRDSMDETPVDTGNLRGSHYVVVKGLPGDEGKTVKFETSVKKGKPNPSGVKVAAEHMGHVQEAKAQAQAYRGPASEVGCTAFYAEKVHEDTQASHMKADKEGNPVQIGKAKFLEDSIRKNANRLFKLICQHAKR